VADTVNAEPSDSGATWRPVRGSGVECRDCTFAQAGLSVCAFFSSFSRSSSRCATVNWPRSRAIVARP
jgi:hypothetical protein